MGELKPHMNEHAFWWNSALTDERKQEILEWQASLSDEEIELLNDTVHDAVDEAVSFIEEDESI